MYHQKYIVQKLIRLISKGIPFYFNMYIFCMFIISDKFVVMVIWNNTCKECDREIKKFLKSSGVWQNHYKFWYHCTKIPFLGRGGENSSKSCRNFLVGIYVQDFNTNPSPNSLWQVWMAQKLPTKLNHKEGSRSLCLPAIVLSQRHFLIYNDKSKSQG